MSLDEKLREIVVSQFPGKSWEETRNIGVTEEGHLVPQLGSHSSELDNFIAQVKQAFTNEGYLPHVEAGKHVKVGDKLYITNGTDPLVQVDLAEFMTGQEWYERFKKEVSKPSIEGTIYQVVHELRDQKQYLEAAKRASGLDELPDNWEKIPELEQKQ